MAEAIRPLGDRVHFLHGDIGIDVGNRAAQIVLEARRRAAAHDQVKVAPRLVHQRLVDLQHRVRIAGVEREVNVAHHADDFAPDHLVALAVADAAADRALARPELSGERFVDGDDRRAVRAQVGRKRATLAQRDAERREKVRSDHEVAGDGLLVGIVGGLPVDLDRQFLRVSERRHVGADRGVFRAGNLGQAPGQLVDHDAALILGIVGGLLGQMDVRDEHVIGVPAVVLLEHGLEAADHHAGRREQGERQRHLPHDQGVPGEVRPPPGGGAAMLLLEGADGIAPGREPRGQQAKQHAGEQRHEQRGGQDAAIHGHRQAIAAGAADANGAAERRVHPEGHEQATEAAADREYHALRELVQDQAEARCAERGANGEVPDVGRGAGQLKIGEVGAGDEQDGAGEGQQQPRDEFAGAVHERLVHLHEVEAAAGAGLRIILGPARGQRRELRVDLLAGNAGVEAADRAEEPVVPVFDDVPRNGNRAPQVDLAPQQRIAEGSRHDADYCDRLCVQADRAADDVGISAEPRLPQRVTEKRDLVVAGHFLGGGVGPAEEGLDAKRGEEVRRGVDRRQSFRRLARLGQRVVPAGKRCQRLEGMRRPSGCAGVGRAGGLDPHLLNLGKGESVTLRLGGGAQDRHEPIRFRKRRAAEKEHVDQRVHRSVDPDAERQRDQRHDRKTGRLDQLAESEAEGAHGEKDGRRWNSEVRS